MHNPSICLTSGEALIVDENQQCKSGEQVHVKQSKHQEQPCSITI
jgi:hypothetical protein